MTPSCELVRLLWNGAAAGTNRRATVAEVYEPFESHESFDPNAKPVAPYLPFMHALASRDMPLRIEASAPIFGPSDDPYAVRRPLATHLTAQCPDRMPEPRRDPVGTLGRALAVRDRLAINDAPFAVEALLSDDQGTVPHTRRVPISSLRVGPLPADRDM